MLFAITAVAGALLQAAPVSLLPPKVVSPLTVTAQPKAPPPTDAAVTLSSGEEDPDSLGATTIFPTHAWYRGDGGEAILTCLIDAHGLAERCRVAWEYPQGRGFGAAALEQQPLIHIAPKRGADGQPISAEMNIAINFKPPLRDDNVMAEFKKVRGSTINGSKLNFFHQTREMRQVVMMNHPVWASAPSFDDVAAAAPADAHGAEGYAVVHCKVIRSSGQLTTCFAARQEPGDKGFGAAAVRLAGKFALSPQDLRVAPHSGSLEVDIPIRFPPASELAERRVSAPSWLTTLDPEKTPKLFPPDAAAQGVTSGRGVARCTVAADGELKACTPEPGEPDGLGFSEAAVKVASMLRVNLWGSDAAPVAGGVIEVPIRLNLRHAN